MSRFALVVAFLLVTGEGLAATTQPADAAKPASGPATTQATEWEFSWDLSFNGWEGIYVEAVETTRLKNPQLGPNAAPWVDLEQLKFNATIGGRLEIDASTYGTSGNLSGFDDGLSLRRLRVTATGEWVLVVPIEYTIEFGYVPEKFVADKFYVRLPEVRGIGKPQVGLFQPPMGLDLITSSRDIAFMEPPAPLQALAPSNELGIQIGKPILTRRATWKAGIFGNGSINTEYGDASKNYGNLIGRLTWLAIDHAEPHTPQDNRYLHLGASANVQYSTTSTVQYRARPESYSAPYLVDTGEIDASASAAFGLESAWVNGPLSLQGEFINSYVGQNDGEGLFFYGLYGQISFFFTGESRRYDRGTGAFARVIPRRNFKAGSWETPGAVEGALRFSYTDLTDGNINGGRMSLFMGEINWYLQPHVKVILNSGFGHVDGGPSDGNVFIAQGRLSMDF